MQDQYSLSKLLARACHKHHLIKSLQQFYGETNLGRLSKLSEIIEIVSHLVEL